MAVPARRHHGAVGAQPDGVGLAGVPCRVDVPGGDRDDVLPREDVALAGETVSGGDDRAVRTQTDRMAPAPGERGPMQRHRSSPPRTR